MKLFSWLAPLLALALHQASAQSSPPTEVPEPPSENPILTAVTVDVIAAALVVTGSDLDDVLTLARSATGPNDYTLTLSSAATLVTNTPSTVNLSGTTVAMIGAANFTTVQINGGNGNDTLHLDTSGSANFNTSAFSYDGQDGEDRMILSFPDRRSLDFNFFNANSGTVTNTFGAKVYRYENLELGLTVPTPARYVDLKYSDASETVTITDSLASGITRVSSSHSQTLDLRNPTDGLSLYAGGGDDSIIVTGVASEGFPSFSLDAEGGTADKISIESTARLVPTSVGAVYLTAESVTHRGVIDNLSSPGREFIRITADTMDFNGGTFRGRNSISLIPADPTATIGIGNGSIGTLNLDANDLAAIADGFSSIRIGLPALGTGDIDIRASVFTDTLTVYGANISTNGLNAGSNPVSFVSPSGIVRENGAATALSAGDFRPRAILSPSGTGVGGTFTQNANLFLDANAGAEFDISDSLSDSFVVNGGVTLDTANLLINNPAPIISGTTLVLISNDGVDPIIGNFNGVIEGGTLQVGGQFFTASYVGGDGNDFTLTARIPEVTFAQTAYSYGENGMPTDLAVTVQRDLPIGDSSVNITFPGTGTASAGIDYTATPIPLIFTGAELSKTVTIPITQDPIVELDESFTLELSSVSNAAIGSQNTATVTILNDDQSSISIIGGDVVEGDSGSPKMILTLSMDNEVDVPVTAQVNATTGGATANVDFTPVSGRFPVTTAGTIIEIPIIPDNLAEAKEFIFSSLQQRLVEASGRNVQLRNGNNGFILIYGIIDDDFTPIAFDDGIYEAIEDRTLIVPRETGVLANDTDQDDGDGPDNLTATLYNPPSRGSVILEADGSFSYTPRPNNIGPDSFAYTASDGTNTSAKRSVRINVTQQIDIALGIDVLQTPIVSDGETFDIFRVTVSNLGPSDATGLTLQQTSSLPSGVRIVGDAESSGVFASSRGNWVLDLAAHSSATLTLAIRADSSAASGAGAIPMAFTFVRADQAEVNPGNNTASASASIISADDTGTTITVAPEVELQSGLFVSKVTVSNDSATQPIPAFRLYVKNLASDVHVYNAQGTRSFGNPPENLPYLLYNRELAANTSVTLTVEFFRASLDPDFTPQYEIELLPVSETEPVAAGGGIPVTRNERLSNGDFLIEIASTPGGTYAVEYSDDMSAWKRVTPTVTAPANRLQWIDNGQPKTESHPSAAPNRYYRFVLIGSPN